MIHYITISLRSTTRMNRPILRTCSRQAYHGSALPFLRYPVRGHFDHRFSQCRHHATDSTTPLTPPPVSSSVSSSVSQDEVAHFTKLAASWWDPHGPSRLLHLMNPLRHDFIQSCLSTDASDVIGSKYTYLDIGCGGGIFATSAARLPSTKTVTAIDPTLSVIQVAQAKQRTDPALSEPKLTYLNCAVEALESTKQFDIITLFEVIEHISDPSSFLTRALSHLKPGGWLIGSTIARHPVSYITTKVVAEAPLIGVVPGGTHDWSQYLNPSELRAWFDKQNAPGQVEGKELLWSNVKIQGVVYIPFIGWRNISGSEEYGNYFFGVKKLN